MPDIDAILNNNTHTILVLFIFYLPFESVPFNVTSNQ